MSERTTKENVETRVENVNRRMESRGSNIRYQVQGRNGYTGLDRFTRTPEAAAYSPESVPGRGIGWTLQSTVMCGTKREVAEFLHAMMVALDDSIH
jgi:hypothetical protein